MDELGRHGKRLFALLAPPLDAHGELAVVALLYLFVVNLTGNLADDA
jgi:hypothetical protein